MKPSVANEPVKTGLCLCYHGNDPLIWRAQRARVAWSN